MSVSSQESSASVLRERALFSHRNPVPLPTVPSIDSRVTRGGDTVDMAGSVAQSQESRDRSARGARHVGGSPRRSRSRSRSRSHRSASRSSSRSFQSPQSHSVSATANVFNVCRSKSRVVRKWVVQGLSKDVAKSLREKFAPKFDGNFNLCCPLLDESIARRWMNAKHLNKLNDFQEKTFKSIQYQMLDAFKPMLHTWNQLSDDSPLLNGVESSLRLLGSAFANVSKLRRANALRNVAPNLAPLLKDPRVFSTRESDRLFGNKFIDTMVKEVDADDKLAKIGRSGGQSNSQWNRGNSSRRNGDRGHSYSGGFQGGAHGGNNNNKGGGRGKNYSNGNSSNKQSGHVRYVAIPHCSSVVMTNVGGRLRHFASAWLSVTDDPWVLSTVSFGHMLDFIGLPVQNSIPSACVMSSDMVAVVDDEITTLLSKGAIRPVLSGCSGDGFLSNLFAIPKKSGGFRVILNLKRLNQFLAYRHFKMEGLDCVKYLIERGDWMVKLDLQDAYHLVAVFPDHCKFLRFVWKEIFYEYVCLPFGLCSAPRVFTKLLRPVVAYLRSLGIRLIIYLDDLLILNGSISGLLHDLKIVIDLLELLGFIINCKKSVFTPQQLMEYLGMLIDSTKLEFSLPPEKVSSIVSLCREVLYSDASGKVTLRVIAKIMGNFSFAIPTVPFAQGHFRELQSLFISQSSKGLDGSVSLSVGARADLEWWMCHLESSNGKSFCSFTPDLVIFSDASLHGWGAVCDGSRTRGPWAAADLRRHINELELLAAFYALQVFTRFSRDINVTLFLDNSTAVAYINKCGGTRSRALSLIAADFVRWCEDRNISLLASHLPGSLNSVADEESRTTLDSSDWMLLASEFRKLSNLWEINIDLFAAAWNAQLPTFVSWLPQPGASAVNAFSLNWTDLRGYAFPPFALIPRCLAKLRRERADLVLVCPLWPSQAWFPLLLRMSVDCPRVLSSDSHLAHSPILDPHPLLLSGKFLLTAWKLSGDVSKIEDFQKTLSRFCWDTTVTPRRLLISRRGTAGLIGTTNGIPIPCFLL